MKTKGLGVVLLAVLLAGQGTFAAEGNRRVGSLQIDPRSGEPARAGAGIKETLQNGLYEEEANRNLDAAIAAYQSILVQYADQRQIAATAVFRLGECYRKQGKNAEAIVQYQRILNEFADQTALANLSRANLTALEVVVPAPTSTNAFDSHLRPLDAQQIRSMLDARLQQARESLSNTVETVEIQRIKSMIENSPDLINAQMGPTEEAPLLKAAREGQLTIVSFLLDHGADVNIRNKQGETSLHEAVYAGNRTMVELLLKRGADVNAKSSVDWTPGKKLSKGATPLHYAAQRGFRAVAEVLVAQGADVNARETSGATPLHYAAFNGDTAIVKLLLAHKAEVNAKGFKGRFGNNNAPVTDDDRTPLHLAAEGGHREVAELLLAAGAKVDARTQEGWAALHLAAARGDLPVVQLLLARKADPSSKDNSGNYVLHSAVSSGKAEVVKALLDAGADVNVLDGSHMTPLFLAVDRDDGAMVELLLQRKADTSVADNRQITPLLLALGSKDASIARLLLQGNANPNQEGRAIDRSSRQQSSGLAVPLWHAVANESSQAAELLLQHGADVSVTNSGGYTLLHAAVNFRNKAIVELLLAHKANPNAVANNGATPLSLAHMILENARVGRPLNLNVLGTETSRMFPLMRSAVFPIQASSGDKDQNVKLAQEIIDLLLKHGADPFLQRRSVIAISRKSANFSEDVFHKDKGGRNHYNLLELWAQQYSSGRSSPPYPDLANIVISRLTGTNGTQEIKVNLRQLLKTGAYDKMPWLEWGDVVDIPEADHLVAANWPGFEKDIVDAMGKGTARQVELIVGAQSQGVHLAIRTSNIPTVQTRPAVSQPVPIPLPSRFAVSERPQETRILLATYLSQAVTLSHLVRTSSDVSRVLVKRKDPATGKLLEWRYDLSKPLGNDDLWLRDGDVIVIPDKE